MLDNIKNLPLLYKEIWEQRPVPSQLVKLYQSYHKPLYIYGKSGAGKTCLSISLLLTIPPKLTVTGAPASQKFLYISFPQLMYEDFGVRNDIIKSLIQYNGILLDDFVPDNNNNTLFFIIIDVCFTRKIPLFITSNYDYKVFDSQPHIARRLVPFFINKFKGA